VEEKEKTSFGDS